MSIYLYEESIINKMREITGDDRIIITPSDNIVNIIPRIANDELKLPLIHVIRNNWKISNTNSHGMKMNGNINNNFPMFDNGSNIIDGKIHRLHTIPITFSHTFEVWTKTRKENDEMIRELIWFFKTMPEFKVKIPYGLNIEHVFTLDIQPDIIDNTSVISHKDSGELFLQAVITTCSDAYLWKSSSSNPTCIEINTELVSDLKISPTISDYNIMTIEQKEREAK